MSRLNGLARLTVAYGVHRVRRRFRKPGPQAEHLLETYRGDRLIPLTEQERHALPAMSRCIGCGLCGLAAGRWGAVTLPDLASSYLRALPVLATAATDFATDMPDLELAAAACPVGVPLPALAAMIRRFGALTA